ncbi:AraC family transcriptional regulator [Pseudomonas aeruginosa]|uniref:AraC family transcriptional regulator n=1 Tax=Pseudomonas aeruginosa TaxID=287 RepID=UPI0029670A97|nr:AraC family transcriptional regulator ligand-binding domain-containing protein [Pseudomonas aeruginosa]MDW2963199.1 AraC family transcriptional regulator ligand-binding domain-containing protein [Pseudomonas aeruginosa]
MAFHNNHLAFHNNMARTDHYVRARGLTGYVSLLTQLGGDARALLSTHGLTPEQIDDEDFTLPLGLFAALISEAAAALGRADFGILLAGRQDQSILGPIALVVQHAGSVGEVLERVARYMPYHSPGLTLGVEREGDSAVLWLEHDLDLQGETRRHVTELAFGVTLAFLRLISRSLGGDWRLELHHDSPLSVAHYRRLFGCPVKLRQGRDRLLFPMALLEVSMDSANPELQEAGERSVRRLIQRYPLDLARQVSGLVERNLPSGSCTLPVIAEQMHMPVHMLQRRLKALGLHFEDIVDELRRKRAENLLPQTHIPLTELAFLLGYGDPSSLTRACKRWFGKSPQLLRQSHSQAHESAKVLQK